MSKLKAVVTVKRRDKTYAQPLIFTLVAKRDRNFFGSRHTMNVEMIDYTTPAVHYVDVHGVCELEKLARAWIQEYYGTTAKDIRIVESTQREAQ